MDWLGVAVLVCALAYLIYRTFAYSRVLADRRRFLEIVQQLQSTEAEEGRAQPARPLLGPRPVTYGLLAANMNNLGFTPVAIFGGTFYDENMTYEELLRLQESVGNVNSGLTTEQIENLPTHTWQDGESSLEGSSTKSEGEEKPTCSICLEPFKAGDIVRTLPCLDRFHAGSCIDRWLDSHKTCPVCRYALL